MIEVARAYGPSLAGEFKLNHEPQLQEETLLAAFSKALANENAGALALLEGLSIGEKNYRYHLRYIARWGTQRRRLLAEGGNFQLLEKVKFDDEQLAGLKLSGTVHDQRRQLAEHLPEQPPEFQGVGWLSPVPDQGRKIQVFADNKVVWIYSPSEVRSHEALHGFVARSLIAKYVPQPGVIADPMSGGGIVAKMATQMGHKVWASDIAPQKPFIAELDLMTTDLAKKMGEEYPTAAADLVIIHPPLPQSLGIRESKYEEWVHDILLHCWDAVKSEGYLALVVPIQTDFNILDAAKQALLDSAAAVVESDADRPTAIHLASTQTGEAGWYILVLQRPLLTDEPSE
jgi:hypothetical protein